METLLRIVLAVIPIRTDMLNELGIAAFNMGHQRIAVACFTRVIKLNPADGLAVYNLGRTLQELGRFDAANACYGKAIELKAQELECENNLGSIQLKLGRLDAARTHFQRVLARDPNHVNARTNLAHLQSSMGSYAEASSSYQAVIRQQPDHAEARFGASLELLRSARWEQGWEEYEWRFARSAKDKAGLKPPLPGLPRWGGENLSGRHILLRAEQGLGDTIQFCRFAANLKTMGARVSLSAQPGLVKLLSSLDTVDHLCIIGKEAELPAADFWNPLLSVPRWLKLTEAQFCGAMPYLRVDAKTSGIWRGRLKASTGQLRVGLVWAGSPTHEKDWNRSMSLSDLAPLATINAGFYALQCGARAAEAGSAPAGMKLINLGPRLKDFSDTAGVIANLDLVITVDTAVAHLAGALGRPVWTLLSLDSDWRWLLGRSDTPWYPSMRLYRQTALGDWDAVIVEVAQDLRALANHDPTKGVPSAPVR